jgi:hypothetical protein
MAFVHQNHGISVFENHMFIGNSECTLRIPLLYHNFPGFESPDRDLMDNYVIPEKWPSPSDSSNTAKESIKDTPIHMNFSVFRETHSEL